MSASASGPIGWLQPSFMPASMSSAVARPSASTKKASLIMGTRMRLTTKPGAFFTVMGVLPSASARALHGVVGGVAGLQAADDLHQRHHGHGVEEVHADEAGRRGW